MTRRGQVVVVQPQRRPGGAKLNLLVAVAIFALVGYVTKHDHLFTHPAGPAQASVTGGHGGHQAVPAVRMRIPYLGTTLPAESTAVRYFGPLAAASHETWVPFAGHKVQVNKVVAANVEALGAALARAGYAGYIRDVGGFRTSVGASGAPIPFSMHQFGLAFDINEDGQADGDWHTMTLPARLVAIASSFGWFCGQSWGGASRDGGHFQFTGGVVTAPRTT